MRSDSGPAFEFAGTSRFQILRRLGGGGMGVVYEALDRERGMRVALKTLRTLDATAVLRFKNEFRWLQDLQHPNLVTFGELFSQDGQWFFTMELVEGVDFLTWVRGGAAKRGDVSVSSPDLKVDPARPISVEARKELEAALGDRVREFHLQGLRPPLPSSGPQGFDDTRLRSAMVQLARGLQALHGAQKVHRDIKPSNILVTPKGRLVLLDFGLAKHVKDGHHSDSHIVGTVDYMAPEQAASKPVGPEADWYSVGTILYEAITGQLPFSGAPLEVLMAKQSVEPTAPRALDPSVPEDLDRLCRELLSADPAQRPGAVEVLKRLGLKELPELPQRSGQAAAPSSPFVGRQREMEVLGGALADTRKGEPVTVYVQGESGVGKSALVRRFTEELAVEMPNVVVLAGRCYERETVPYKAFDGVVDALSRYMMKLPKAEAAALLPLRTALLAQVFPVLRRVEAVAQAPLQRNEVSSPQELRTRVFAALRELLARLAERHPLILWVDDLQWADADSLALLAEVMRPPEAPAVMLIATVRLVGDGADKGRGALYTSTISGDVRHVQVKRLPPGEARELVALLLGRGENATAEIAQAIADEADGHPLFIDALVRHATAHPGEPGSGPTGVRLDEALWARVGRLDATVRYVLELVAVAGGPITQEDAAVAAAIDFGELQNRVGQLRAGNLVRTSGARRTDAIEPYHDRVREAVLQHFDDRSRVRCHVRLALALEASGHADPEALSVHWLGAGDPERAAHYAVIAAREATEALAFDRAARLYRKAIELRPDEGAGLQAQLGAVLASAGRGGDAALAYLEAAKIASHTESIDLQRKAAEQLLISGHVDAGLEALGRVLDESGMKLPKSDRAALYALGWARLKLRMRGLEFERRDAEQIPPAQLNRIDVCQSVGIGLGLVDNLRGPLFQARQLLFALDAGEPFRVARGLTAEAVFHAGVANHARTNQILARLSTLAKSLNAPLPTALAEMAAGFARFLGGDFREARRRLEVAETMLRERCSGVAWELDTTQVVLLASMGWVGALKEQAERVPQLVRSAQERGDLFALTTLHTALHVVHLLADDGERARAESADAMQKWSQRGFYAQHYYDLHAQTQAALYLGETRRALELLDEKWGQLQAAQQLRVQLVRVQTHELKARVHLRALTDGSEARAQHEREVAKVVALLYKERRPWTAALAAFLEAQLRVVGRAPDAARTLEVAEASLRAADLLLHAQLARRLRGLQLGGDEGHALAAESAAWLTSESVRNVPRFAALFAPAERCFPDGSGPR